MYEYTEISYRVHVRPETLLDFSTLYVYSRSITYTGYQRGIDVIGSTSLIYKGKADSFTWNDHGFKLHLPRGAFTSECPIHLEAAISGQFQFPDGAELVSGVYCIHSLKQFTKTVTFEIQHFSSSDTQKEIDELCVVFSSRDQFPCQFTYHEDCTFSVGSQYGAIETKSFGKFAIVKRKKKGRFSSRSRTTSHNLYRAHFLYIKESDSNWTVIYSIIQQAELYSKVTIANRSIGINMNIIIFRYSLRCFQERVFMMQLISKSLSHKVRSH